LTLAMLALRNLGRNRRRTALTGAVVACGFTAFVLAGSFVLQSFDGLRRGTIRSGTGHLQLAAPGTFDGADRLGPPSTLADAERIAGLVREDPAVAEVLPRIELVGLLTEGTRSVPFLGFGLDAIAEARSMDPAGAIAQGRWLAAADDRAVVLGSGLARSLGVGAGDTVTLLATSADGTFNGLDAAVVGLCEIPLADLDQRYLAAPVELAAELLLAPGRVTKLVVVLHEPADARAALARLAGRLRDQGFAVEGRTWEELAPFYGQVRNLYVGIFGSMGLVLVVVVLLAAANTMMMAAAERTREVGTLRALGMRPVAVRRLFLAEGALLALGACAAGAALALLLREVLNRSGIVLPPPPGVSRGLPLHVELYPAVYAAAFALLSATLVAAAWLPARRAARRPIVEALAHV
jgi:putative ABC transport system permease protein